MNATIYKFEKDMLEGKSIHIYKKQDNLWSKKHWHNYYEIVYYSGCSGHCILNGEKHPITENCLFLLTPKDFHEVFTNDIDNSYSLIISFNEQITDANILDALTHGPYISYNISQKLASKLQDLYEMFNSFKKHRDTYMKHLFNCILLEILEDANASSSINHSINPIVRQSISIMLSNPTYDFSLDFFAQKFNVTTAYFSRLFHKNTGVSFKQYITSLRLEYAKQLLDENVLPIIDIGYECGFNTPSQFYRAFKKDNAITPSEYRHQRKNVHN